MFTGELSKLRLNGLFTRKTELINKVDKRSIGFRKFVDFRSEMMVGGSEAARAIWNIFIFSTATCWQGYTILVGFLPVLSINQIALTTAIRPSVHRPLGCVLCFFIEWGQLFISVISFNL